MAKFLKSIFNPAEKRKAPRHDGGTEDDKTEEPPMDGRRKLSISRSGRMKQANRKRHSLSLDLYGENAENESTEKAKTTEVQEPTSAPADIEGDRQNRRRSADDYNDAPKVIHSKTVDLCHVYSGNQSKHRRLSIEPKSPEEEIDSAFEIIDKS